MLYDEKGMLTLRLVLSPEADISQHNILGRSPRKNLQSAGTTQIAECEQSEVGSGSQGHAALFDVWGASRNWAYFEFSDAAKAEQREEGLEDGEWFKHDDVEFDVRWASTSFKRSKPAK